jgi:hypothetical protein
VTSAQFSRGLYHYFCNGESSGIEETWEIREQGDERRISSVRFARPVGITLRVSSIERNGLFSHCSFHWRRRLAEGAVELSADYRFDDDGLVVHVHDGAEELLLRESGRDFIFSPLMRIYNGPVIESLIERGGSAEVMVPWIVDPDETTRLLHPTFSQRQAKLVGEGQLRVDGKQRDAREYDYSGGEYPPGTRFWVDEQQVMLGYSWQQDRSTRWEIKLRDYVAA